MSARSDLWGTNLPYLAAAALVTVATHLEAVATAFVWAKNVGAAVLLFGLVVTVALELLGYDRDPLREAVFGRRAGERE